MHRFSLIFCSALLGLFCSSLAFNHGQALVYWNDWKAIYHPDDYPTAAALNNAQFYYNYNRKMIDQQNALAARNVITYTLAENQFSDMRLQQFAALLPKSVYPAIKNDAGPIATQPVNVQEFDPRITPGLTITPADQGKVCSSSWAYATAKAIELKNAAELVNLMPDALSAQNLIDCAGSGTACTTQVPQAGFDYLTQYPDKDTELLTVTDYPNNNTLTQQGMCVPNTVTVGAVRLTSYAVISDNDDDTLMRYVANNIPVIVEYNPNSFGFMHYKSGIYQPPASNGKAATSSQFLIVLGFGHDTSLNLDYWLCLNSFGTTWGENGFIKIIRNGTQKIAKNAILPYELV